FPGLLDAVLEGVVVRSRRAVRGRGGNEHPRVFIWGLLEARLQAADLVVLGGLTETVWPPASDSGPWINRPMRARTGLPSPEERRPVSPPRPRPPVGLRPRRLSVTEIETWLRDPYAIYARHVLRVRKLDALDQSTDAADYGSIVHDSLHRFLREHGTEWPPDA